MKLGFKKVKFLCCIVLSLVLAFGNFTAIFNGSSNQKVCAAAPGYYDGFVDINPIYLNSYVSLSGRIYYTYCVYPDGSQYFYTINRIDTWLIGDIYWYHWTPEGCGYSYNLSPNCKTAYIKLYGYLDDDYWNTTSYITKDYSLWF